jgi:acyl dehydratase
MSFDAQVLVAREPIVSRTVVSAERIILYALGVGADELPFVYERGLEPLPSMALILAYPGFFWSDSEYNVDWQRLLQGGSGFTLHAPIPASGEMRGFTRFSAVVDKGSDKGAVVHQVREVYDERDRHIATVRNTSILRGNGGCGSFGEAPAVRARSIPERAPDIEFSLSIAANQALLYRLSGDLNPLHVDPSVARAAGFNRPLLQGLCTLGIASRAVLGAVMGNDPKRMRQLDARFASPTFPGETLITEIWRAGDHSAHFRSRVLERGVTVLNNGYVEFE